MALRADEKAAAFQAWARNRQSFYAVGRCGRRRRTPNVPARSLLRPPVRQIVSSAAAWPLRMEGLGGPAQSSPTIGQCLDGGYGWLEVKCRRCETRASIPLDAVRRPKSTSLWKLEAALKCRSCRMQRYAPPVHLIRLTQSRAIAPYIWCHPDDDR